MSTTAAQPKPSPHSESSAAAIEVHQLRSSYGDFEAVRGVDLRVEAGEVFALLGTNGAGKTTTLEVLEGFQPRTAGEVRVLGFDPATGPAELHRRTGTMMQEGGFLNELTPHETLSMWSRLVDRRDDPERLLARFELLDRRDVPVGKLSGGERRRLDLALALWGPPELAILDEPTTGLDPWARERTWEAINELSSDGVTVVLTTHYLEEAEALADQIAIMHEGKIAISGSLSKIVSSRPAQFAAGVEAARAGELAEAPLADDRLTVNADGRFHVSTNHLQGELTTFLQWADQRELALADLRAAPASLSEVYRHIRSNNPKETH